MMKPGQSIRIVLSGILLSFLLALSATSSGIHRRTNTKKGFARATLEVEGMGTCGIQVSKSAYQVALNAQDYGTAIKSPHCNKNITIKVGGKTVKGLLVDKCSPSMGCIADADAEFTPVLYDAVAPDGTNTDPSKGKVPLLQGSWEFDD